MNYSAKLAEESVRLGSKITAIENTLSQLPSGELRYWKNGDNFKHFIEVQGKRKYIPLVQKELIVQMAKKKILIKMLLDAQQEKCAIDSYLKKHNEKDRVKECLAREPHLAELLQPLFEIRDSRLKNWAEAAYPSTAGYPEKLIHPGPGGRMYRSKSEAMIAHILYVNRIPFRYEWDREINGIVYHIDFTIRHPKTGETFYWEHFGKMDDIGYVMRNARKLVDYESAGIFPDKNLILTYESGKNPLSIGKIEELVEKWFLN